MSELAVRLCVNVDHVATLRQARQVDYPDPLRAAALAEAAGASGITVHLREDRRHIQEEDVARLRQQVRGKLNLEMAATDAMVGIALELGPHQVTLVPERPDEVTTEGGLDLLTQAERIQRAASTIHEAGLETSVFLDPETEQVRALGHLLSGVVTGFEINTDAYTRAKEATAEDQLAKIRQAAALGQKLGFKVYAGHGLTTGNVAPVSAIPAIEELNIGHSIVARAVLVGMEAAVREILEAIAVGIRRSA